MPQVTFNVPAAIAQELNGIAREQGYTNAKEMVIAYLKGRIKAKRGEAAIAQVDSQVDTDTAGIG